MSGRAAARVLAGWALSAASATLGLQAAPAQAAEPLSWLTSPGLPDDEFSFLDLRGGKRLTHAECNSTPDAVWVEHHLGSECIRYYPSHDVPGAKVAALFFHGDRLDGNQVIAYGDNHADKLRQLADTMAKVHRVPYIFVARPGVYGSSGRHNERRTLKEYLSLDAAVDAIKARYGFERVHLGGQSGGAATVGALLTLGRTDIACAVASSGPFDALARAHDIADRGGRSWNGCDVTGRCDAYNVTDHASSVARSATRRIFLIGDPIDANTEFKYQQAFAGKLQALGHDVTLTPANGLGPMHHGLDHMANRTLGWCNRGLPSDKIRQLIANDTLGLGADKTHAAD